MTTVPPSASPSLYVGDLPPDVTEPLLHEVFRVIGVIQSIRLCRDAFTRRSLGYAYVNFTNVEDAERALEALNYHVIKGKPMRIMWSHRDPAIRRSGVGNVFIKNLHPDIDNKALNDTFSQFGLILSCKVATDENSKSRGFGFVHFETQEAAELAISSVNGKEMLGQTVSVCMWKSRRERMRMNQERFTNLYVKNLPLTMTKDDLQALFAPFGEVTSAVVMTKEGGESKGFGFVNFAQTEQAKRAVDGLNGKEIEPGKALYVARAQKKAERRLELTQRHQQMQRDKQHMGVNLFIKNLDEDIDDERLYQEFSQFGTITSHKVARDEDKRSKGFGFVCFSTPEEATRAVTEMNNRMFGSKPLYVALHQKKEVRRRMLEDQRLQRQAVQAQYGMPPQNMPPPGVYPPVFYQQGPMPPQGFGQYPAMPMRPRWNAGQVPGGMPVDGFQAQGVPTGFMPQQGHRPNPRPNRRPNQGQQGAPGGPRGAKTTGYKLSSTTRNREQVPPPGAGMPPGYPMQPAMYMQPMPTQEQDLPSLLASASPEDRRMILGERLYPLVEQICHDKVDMTPKITGMLLQMDTAEILGLLESTADLENKVEEAVKLIEYSAAQAHLAEEHGGVPSEDAQPPMA